MLMGIWVFVVLAMSCITILTRYKRCPADQIIVVYGKLPNGKAAMCVREGWVFVWPLIQDFAYLSLHPMRIETQAFEAVANRDVSVRINLSVTVAVSTEPEIMQNAAERLLGLEESGIINQARDIITGQARRLIALLQADQFQNTLILTDRLRPQLDTTLNQIGLHVMDLQVVSLNISAFSAERFG